MSVKFAPSPTRLKGWYPAGSTTRIQTLDSAILERLAAQRPVADDEVTL